VAVPSFIDILAARGVLLADGGTGTNYQHMGIEPGIAPEQWVFDEPERVVDLHRSFADVGCDLVSTCTFGGSLTKDMALEGFAEQALGLADGGVDVMLLETFFTLDEGLWAAEAIRELSAPDIRHPGPGTPAVGGTGLEPVTSCL
jgi:methionine synthase I (cobalamin-dependent)